MTGWRKSSYSDVNTNCVEIGWFKSSYSGGNTNCVEVATVAGRVGVRDSKNPGAELAVPGQVWREFLISLD